jgi:exodeoxyribonuclease III
MSDDATQGMLFGSITGDAKQPAQANPGTAQLRLCALNVNSPSPQRAQQIADWLLKCGANTLVLTEMQPSDGCRLIMSCLEAEGFTVTCGPDWRDHRYIATVAARDSTVIKVQPAAFHPRIVAVNITSARRHGDKPAPAIRLVAVYAPTNGMTNESSHRRRTFQQQLINYLTAIWCPNMVVAGDLNVVEPGHQPHLPAFADHDYAFYTALLNLGLADAYRTLNPTGTDHSWISDRYGAQRLDHTLVTTATGAITTCGYDHEPRTQRITDHAALLTTIDLATPSTP